MMKKVLNLMLTVLMHLPKLEALFVRKEGKKVSPVLLKLIKLLIKSHLLLITWDY